MLHCQDLILVTFTIKINIQLHKWIKCCLYLFSIENFKRWLTFSYVRLQCLLGINPELQQLTDLIESQKTRWVSTNFISLFFPFLRKIILMGGILPPFILFIIFIMISSSSASCHATSTDIPGPLWPLLPIVHRLWQVFWVTSHILT